MPRVVPVKDEKVRFNFWLKKKHKDVLQKLAEGNEQSVSSMINEILDEALKPFYEEWSLAKTQEDLLGKLNSVHSILKDFPEEEKEKKFRLVYDELPPSL